MTQTIHIDKCKHTKNKTNTITTQNSKDNYDIIKQNKQKQNTQTQTHNQHIKQMN